MTVKVAVPVEINNSILTSSDIPEPDPSVGEVAWEDEASKYEETTITGPIDYWLNFEMTRTSHGELIVVGALRNTWALVKFDVNGSLVWSTEPGTDTGNLESEMNFIGCSVSGDDLIMFWHNDNNQSVNFDKVYRQIITGIAAQGSLPSYTGSSTELVNFPVAIKQSENKRLLEQNGLIYAAHNNGVDVSQNISVSALYGSDGGLIVTKTESFSGGRVNSISPDGDGGFYVCAIGRKIIQFSAQLERVKESNLPLVKSKFERVAYYNNIITVGGLTSTNQNVMILTDVNQDFNLLSSYKKDDEVVYLPNHTKYICLADETFSNPSETATGDANAEWLKIGLSNKWAMFDKSVSYSSLMSSDTSVVITPSSEYSAVGCVGISGIDSVTIEILDQSDSTLYTETKSTANPDPEFSEFKLSEILFTDIPPFIDTKVKVTFNVDSGGSGKIGDLIVGKSYSLGEAVLGTQSNTKDFSEQKEDKFGNFEYIERAIVPSVTYQIDVKKNKAIAVQRFVNSLRGKSNLWYADIGESEFLTVYGRCETIPMTYENHSIVSYKAKVRGTI